ncbi:MAG: hypothetical protein HQK67_09160 [Desulfamplus sp.]|nr:hypothetical protein [Desulfamplus sp.]
MIVGETIFCSHAMFTVNQLCDRVIWFDKGEIKNEGIATHVTASYENYNLEKTAILNEKTTILNQEKDSHKIKSSSYNFERESIPVIVKSIRLNRSTDAIDISQGESLEVDIEYENIGELPFFIAAGIRRNDNLICHAANMAKKIKKPLTEKGCGRITLKYKNLPFLHGKFYVVISMLDDSGLQCFHQKESAAFSVLPEDKWAKEIGLLKLDHEWIVNNLDCKARVDCEAQVDTPPLRAL